MCQQPTYYVYAIAILFFELNGQTNAIEVKITQKTESVIHLIVYIMSQTATSFMLLLQCKYTSTHMNEL